MKCKKHDQEVPEYSKDQLKRSICKFVVGLTLRVFVTQTADALYCEKGVKSSVNCRATDIRSNDFDDNIAVRQQLKFPIILSPLSTCYGLLRFL
jgi:hypothetical protein